MNSNNTHNTHNPFTGDGVTNTHNPLTGDKTGPHPPPGTNPMTGRTKDGNLGRNEQQPPEARHTGATGPGTGMTSGANTHNTHNPLTGDGVTNTHNPMTGGYTDTGAHTTGHTGAHTSVTSGTNTHNTHNPLTGDGVTNTHNPLTGDKTGPNPPPGTNPVTGRTNDGNLGRHEQQPGGYTGTGAHATGTHTTGTHTTGAHTTGHTGTHTGVTSGTNTHNTHNPLTGDGVTNTHNPMTGDKTGPNPPPGTNPVTGRTNDGNLGRHEQQPLGATGTTGTTGAGPHPTSTQASGGGAKAMIGKVEATLGSIIKNPSMHAKGVQKQEEAQAAKLAKEEAAHGDANIRH
ncbi:hypothetical protein RhiTH_002574 [Rhizoctonia solani]